MHVVTSTEDRGGCASRQEPGEVTDVLFRQQGSWLNSRDNNEIVGNLKRMARLGGVSDATADACLKDQNLQNAVLQQSNTYGNWQQPQGILVGRSVKMSVQYNF